MPSVTKHTTRWRELYVDASLPLKEATFPETMLTVQNLQPGTVNTIDKISGQVLIDFVKWSTIAQPLAGLRFAASNEHIFFEIDAEGAITRFSERPDWVKSQFDLKVASLMEAHDGQSLEEYFRDILSKSPKERSKILSHDFMLQLDGSPSVEHQQNESNKKGSAFTVADLSLDDFTWLVEYLNKAVSEKTTPDMTYFDSVTTGKLTREQKFGIRTYYKAIVGRTLTAKPGYTGDDNYFSQISEGLSTVKNIGVKKFHDKVSEVVTSKPDITIKDFRVY